jgi:predicted O-methyltransferase YrrM
LPPLDAKIRRVISRLDRQSNREREGKAAVARGLQMLAITADTGMFFSILLKSIKARRILEIGTSTGFSTLWFADALLENRGGTIITVEEDGKKIERAQKNFQQAGVDGIIKIVEGRALDVLRQMSAKKKFDFVFIDADKENVKEYFSLVLPMVRVGGIIAVDNMLYPERYRPYMSRYAKYVQNMPDVQSVTVPIGMGEEITVKLR